ncbi:hypothetical protein CEXT_255781 [Caerostris extrusa]|uniref:Uncharacterized protein n=1 Tax=Caerostris extrusa TaxID=172846 RepID=A0AAV4WLJ6_CAEEX|nr:hypothetical protein CEXT_255781 [Caerostris extrusa]
MEQNPSGNGLGTDNTSTVVTCLHPFFELPSPHETTPWIRQSPDDFVTWPKGDLLLRDTPFLANDFQRGLYQASDSGAKGDEGVFGEWNQATSSDCC